MQTSLNDFEVQYVPLERNYKIDHDDDVYINPDE